MTHVDLCLHSVTQKWQFAHVQQPNGPEYLAQILDDLLMIFYLAQILLFLWDLLMFWSMLQWSL